MPFVYIVSFCTCTGPAMYWLNKGSIQEEIRERWMVILTNRSYPSSFWQWYVSEVLLVHSLLYLVVPINMWLTKEGGPQKNLFQCLTRIVSRSTDFQPIRCHQGHLETGGDEYSNDNPTEGWKVENYAHTSCSRGTGKNCTSLLSDPGLEDLRAVKQPLCYSSV